MNLIGQYYDKEMSGIGSRYRLTPGFESCDPLFAKRRGALRGKTGVPSLAYDCCNDAYFVCREESCESKEGSFCISHGFLFPTALFEKNVFGAKLYRFFDIGDFDCTVEGYNAAESPAGKAGLTVVGDCCDFLRPADVFWQCKENQRFVKLLFYATLMAVTGDFSLVFALPEKNPATYEQTAVSTLKSLFAMMPWELREYLTFHTNLRDRYALGAYKLCFTTLSAERLPKNNRLFLFDLLNYKVSPDLVIEQKSRGTVTGDLLFLIWSYQDEEALAALFYIFHHNRGLLGEGKPKMVLIDALSCYFLLQRVGEKYRGYLGEELARISKGAAREILLCLAGHLTDTEFVKLREMLSV